MCCARAVRKVGRSPPLVGCFMEFEVGVHDGTNKGQLHSHVPFIGRKTLTMLQKAYNDVHGYYRARFCRWVVFKGVPGTNTVIIGAVPALCENPPKDSKYQCCGLGSPRFTPGASPKLLQSSANGVGGD